MPSILDCLSPSDFPIFLVPEFPIPYALRMKEGMYVFCTLLSPIPPPVPMVRIGRAALPPEGEGRTPNVFPPRPGEGEGGGENTHGAIMKKFKKGQTLHPQPPFVASLAQGKSLLFFLLAQANPAAAPAAITATEAGPV